MDLFAEIVIILITAGFAGVISMMIYACYRMDKNR